MIYHCNIQVLSLTFDFFFGFESFELQVISLQKRCTARFLDGFPFRCVLQLLVQRPKGIVTHFDLTSKRAVSSHASSPNGAAISPTSLISE